MNERQSVLRQQEARIDLVHGMRIRRLTQPPQFQGVLSADLVELARDSYYAEHIHHRASTMLYVVAGSGTVLFADEEVPVSRGDCVYVPAGCAHGFQVEEEPLLLLSVQSPPIFDPHTLTEDIELSHRDRPETERK